ncbi:MAG: hypothetical protein ACC631_00630 [Halocynthiibacter sp.]
MARRNIIQSAAHRLLATLIAGFVALLSVGVPAAVAHSFTTLLVLPESAMQSEARQDAERAFLLASEERDGHAQQESDGHLGGLDVYLKFATPDAADIIAAAAPDIVAAPFADPDANAENILTRIALPTGAVPLTGPDIDSSQSQTFLARAAGLSRDRFAERFEAATGRAPGPGATAVYVTARQIDLAVRANGGVADRAGLRRLLAQ